VSLTADEEAVLKDLRAALWAAGYSVEGIAGVLGVETDSVSVPPGDIPVVDRRLPRSEPLPTLMRLFLMAVPVPVGEADAALGAASIERCEELGLLERDRETVQAPFRVVPSRGVLVVVDREHEFSTGLEPDHVMGITPSTSMLADLTPRAPVGATLDVCCGSGLQGLLAARHSGRVVATDINQRALRFGDISARLNGIDNIEMRTGDLFEPVGEDTFDLVVSNPPFVISPDTAYAYRDSDLEGDEISQRVVRGAAAHLSEGGTAVVMVGWAHRREQPWDEPLRPWVGGLGCDAWLLRHSSADPLDYAVGFNRPLAPLDPEGYSDAIDRWLDYDQRLGIEAIGYGAIVLRKRAGANWLRADTLHTGVEGPAGDLVERMIKTQDVLSAAIEDEKFLDLVLRANPRHRLEQMLRPEGDGYAVHGAGVILEESMSFRAAVDVHAVQILLHLDGARTLRDALELARSEVEPGMTPEEFANASLRPTRRMVELGFALP
jgi:methylase of polypeptide subunit release factors